MTSSGRNTPLIDAINCELIGHLHQDIMIYWYQHDMNIILKGYTDQAAGGVTFVTYGLKAWMENLITHPGFLHVHVDL